MDERLARTVEALREIGADWAILSSADSIAYALGYAPPIESGPSAFAAGPNVAVVGRDGSAGMLALEGDAASPREGIALRYDGYGQLPASPPDALYCETFRSLIRLLGVSGSIATEPATLPAIIDAMLPSNQKGGLAQALRRQRMTKTADEVDALRRSAEVAAAGQRQFIERVRPEISELQLFSEMRAAMETAPASVSLSSETFFRARAYRSGLGLAVQPRYPAGRRRACRSRAARGRLLGRFLFDRGTGKPERRSAEALRCGMRSA